MKIVLIIFLILCYLMTGFIVMDWFVDKSVLNDKLPPWWVNLITLLLWPVFIVLMLIVIIILPFYKFGVWAYNKITGKNKQPVSVVEENTTTSTDKE